MRDHYGLSCAGSSDKGGNVFYECFHPVGMYSARRISAPIAPQIRSPHTKTKSSEDWHLKTPATSVLWKPVQAYCQAIAVAEV